MKASYAITGTILIYLNSHLNILKQKFVEFHFTLLFILIVTPSYSQQTPLKIGDKIPEIFWNTPLNLGNSSTRTATFAEERDKLILLDFWDTMCSACLIYFPKMEELQRQFGNKVKIMGVTSQTRTTIDKFFSTKNGNRYKQIISITDDKIMHSFFPHVGIPFVVWIKNGYVLNTTNAEQVTDRAIKEILDGEKSSLQTVIQMTREHPLMLADSYYRQRNLILLNYSIIIKGYIPDIGSGSASRKTLAGLVYGRQFTNLPLKDIYFSIGYEIFFNKYNELFNNNRIVMNVRDSLEINPPINSDGTFDHKNLYSYEFNLPENETDSIYSYMLKDLNRYTNYEAKVEQRLTKCLVLIRTSKIDKMASKGGNLVSTFPRSPSILRNAPMVYMVNMLNGEIPSIKLPVIDETNYTGMVDIEISGIKNLANFKKELKRYDLDLVETERDLLMLVISDKNL